MKSPLRSALGEARSLATGMDTRAGAPGVSPFRPQVDGGPMIVQDETSDGRAERTGRAA